MIFSNTTNSNIGIIVYDVLGNIIYKEKYSDIQNNEIVLKSSVFPIAGLYFISIENEGGLIVKKIVKK